MEEVGFSMSIQTTKLKLSYFGHVWEEIVWKTRSFSGLLMGAEKEVIQGSVGWMK